mmetsp:Transcript_38987/g.79820  ORF Transcript_38987/g.79820 Transcript_38987/m.79820 type:complete len:100 (-) Transcript_38987:533-832(-)
MCNENSHRKDTTRVARQNNTHENISTVLTRMNLLMQTQCLGRVPPCWDQPPPERFLVAHTQHGVQQEHGQSPQVERFLECAGDRPEEGRDDPQDDNGPA